MASKAINSCLNSCVEDRHSFSLSCFSCRAGYRPLHASRWHPTAFSGYPYIQQQLEQLTR
ncbi:unnamed protein product [Prunus armeniaca]|uniref:Uncharacterized protein n=1 Tax=Prunus armeniaca TaxID=36596 RepID=A0A6J5UZH7_PRUAR|nr:unnamed protein product [Prunus armeniaca]CAB4311862.1 unnamed protein product [Prunus armeniaca]